MRGMNARKIFPVLIFSFAIRPMNAPAFEKPGHVEPVLVYDFADPNSYGDLSVPSSVRQTEEGLDIRKSAQMMSESAAKSLTASVRASGELTAEIWFEPSSLSQSGPARILTISKDSSNRNFTIGQDGDRIDIRLRTTRTSQNGIPSLPTPRKSLKKQLTHLVYTHRQDGDTRIYLDGREVAARKIDGNLKNWDTSFKLAIANELTGDRPWLGTIRFVSIYDHALPAATVEQRFGYGPSGQPSPEAIAARKKKQAEQHFETVVAPILARHCLECHDTASRSGELDLSKKLPAMQGGSSGPAIIPGNPQQSHLWLSVVDDEMPLDREPLNDDEKAAMKKWLNDGATWSLTEIDPAVYEHSAGEQRYVRRLTRDEYIATVLHSVGVDISSEARETLPADLRADGFSNTSYNLNVDLKHVEAYGRLADQIVDRMDVRKFVERFSKRRKFTDKDMADAIGKVGKWVLRGPLETREIIAYRGIMTTVASSGGSFDDAMSLVIEAMLQSPRFLYRVEQQNASGTVDSWELASRLSYIIWGGPPDAELFKLAESDELPGQIEQQTNRMLRDPRAVQQSLRFVSDWLNLNRLENLRPNSKRFPTWKKGLAEDMREETLRFAEEVIWKQNRPLTALLNAQVTFVSPELAEFYGLRNSDRESDGRINLQNEPSRGGLLTHGSLLTAGGDNASMVTRGLLVMHELLRGVVRDPPPCVDTTPLATRAGLTQRSMALERINNASCGGCHSRFEPLAFGLERYNGLGAYRKVDEHGNELREDGEILFPGSGSSVRYQTSAELMELLAQSDRVAQTFTWKVAQFAVGRPLGAQDARIVDEIHQRAKAGGGKWQDIITAIVSSEFVEKRTH